MPVVLVSQMMMLLSCSLSCSPSVHFSSSRVPQVLNAAWDAGIPVASENALPCYDREGYNKVLANAKPSDDPDRHHLSAFTYLRLCSDLMEEGNFKEFARFVARLHGEPISAELL